KHVSGFVKSQRDFCFDFFFFQAEDGIRDFHVTGVQTCALPISPRRLVRVLLLDRQVVDRDVRPLPREGDRHGAADPGVATGDQEIGRASCRERGWLWVGGASMKEKRKEQGGQGCSSHTYASRRR